MLRTTVGVPDLGAAFDGLEGEFAAAATTAMRGATETLKTTLRDQVRSAGMGTRLANTWRAKAYPESRNALDPAGYAWSNAPGIIDAFARGATIVALGGRAYLWIPTRNVPRAPGQGRATSTKRMTPEQLLASLGLNRFVIKRGRAGHLLAFVVEGRGSTPGGRLRRVRKGRLAHGADGQLVLMYTLAATIGLPKKFDLQDAADYAAADFVERFEQAVR